MARPDKSGLGEAKLGKAGSGMAGEARFVLAGYGKVGPDAERHGEAGVACLVVALHVQSRRGTAKQNQRREKEIALSIYRWVTGSHIRGSAQAAGEECAKLEMRGELTPQALVDESRPEDAPLHDMFNWNDEEAAELYRQTQAQYIIRSVEVVAIGDSKPVRAFVSVQADDKSRIYQRTEVALSIKDTRDQVLQAALSELRAFERKYGRLAELADVIAAIRRVA